MVEFFQESQIRCYNRLATDIFSRPIVIDTNLLFEGLTKQGSAADLIVSAWLAGLLNVYISNALLYE
jgi:hypothetical protein